MSNVERLEKFKKQINFLDDSADMDDFGRFVDTLQNMYEDGEFHWVARYLKEQAEQVEEQQKKIEQLEQILEQINPNLSEELRVNDEAFKLMSRLSIE